MSAARLWTAGCALFGAVLGVSPASIVAQNPPARSAPLHNMAARPIQPVVVTALRDSALEAGRPELGFDTTSVIYAGAQLQPDGALLPGATFSPDGSLMAVSIASQEIDFPDQIWIYRLHDDHFVPATPTPTGDGLGMVQAMAWRDATTLLIRMGTRAGPNSTVIAATISGSRVITSPSAIETALLDSVSAPSFRSSDAAAPTPAAVDCDDCDADWPLLRYDEKWLSWVSNRSGTMTLNVRLRNGGAPPVPLAWGSWPLLNYLFDANTERVIFQGSNGITVYHMPDGELRRIAGTWPDDMPIALDVRNQRLAWITTAGCGRHATERGRQRICMATLDWGSR